MWQLISVKIFIKIKIEGRIFHKKQINSTEDLLSLEKKNKFCHQ